MSIVSSILRDIMTTVADKFNEPAGLLFDMSALSKLEREYTSAVEVLDAEVSELRAKLEALEQKLEEE